MKSLAYFAVAAQQVATHGVHVMKLECRINDNGAAALFWQVHDSASVPAEGAVPLKSWPVSGGAADYKEFKNGELDLANGLYVCVSTTEATKTLGTGNNAFAAVLVELYDPEAPTGTTVAGDLTTGVSSLVVFSGIHRLITVNATNNSGAAGWLMIFTHAPSEGDAPLAAIPFASGQNQVLTFGDDGRESQDQTPGTGVLRTGCRLRASTTGDVLTTAAAGSWTMQAEYK